MHQLDQVFWASPVSCASPEVSPARWEPRLPAQKRQIQSRKCTSPHAWGEFLEIRSARVHVPGRSGPVRASPGQSTVVEHNTRFAVPELDIIHRLAFQHFRWKILNEQTTGSLVTRCAPATGQSALVDAHSDTCEEGAKSEQNTCSRRPEHNHALCPMHARGN
eukprot:gene25895-biopygen19529